MTTELTVLTLAALLQITQFVVLSVRANMELTPGYLLSARDRPPSREMSERTARMQRAFANHFEGLILFTIAVGVIQMSSQNTGFTGFCAWLYLTARIAYVPAYVLGLKPHRSLIWVVSLLAILLMLIAALI